MERTNIKFETLDSQLRGHVLLSSVPAVLMVEQFRTDHVASVHSAVQMSTWLHTFDDLLSE